MTPNPEELPSPAWLAEVRFDAAGLVPAIAQDVDSGAVLMVAWMNAEALTQTAERRVATYFSRSRQRLWVKGESSGNAQDVIDLRLDCDGDCVLMRVRQHGGIACHTGREHCFYRQLRGDGEGATWQVTEPVRRDPADMYSDGGAE